MKHGTPKGSKSVQNYFNKNSEKQKLGHSKGKIKLISWANTMFSGVLWYRITSDSPSSDSYRIFPEASENLSILHERHSGTMLTGSKMKH